MKIITASLALILLVLFRASNTVESFSTTTASAKAAWRLFSSVDQQQQQGGPPASAVRPGGGPPTGGPQGGPPGGGPPRGGPPGGGPPGGGGGPPPQTTAQKFLEQGLDVAFKILYLGDEIGLQDSSKNLRVLWTRVSRTQQRGGRRKQRRNRSRISCHFPSGWQKYGKLHLFRNTTRSRSSYHFVSADVLFLRLLQYQCYSHV